MKMSKSTLILKQVKLYNLLYLSKYINIRYKIFIKEMGRSIIFGEFHFDDLFAKHYILLSNNNIIGTARLIYKDPDIAEAGRIAIHKNYRNQGYGKLIVNKLLEIIKSDDRASTVSLLSEDDKVDFYKKLGFIANDRIFTYSVPLTRMITNVSSQK